MEFEQLSMFQETGFKMKKVKPMKILVACEESQAVCIELRKLGHEAYSADIQECSGGHPEWHIFGDVIPLINGDCMFNTMNGIHHQIIGEWDMLIAFPPCTFLTKTGNRWFNVKKYGDKAIKRIEDRRKAANFFMMFANAKCKKILIENPIGYMSTIYRKPDQIIHPFYFAKDENDENCERKSTGLWLKGLPKLQYNIKFSPRIVKYKSSKKTDSAWHINTINLPKEERSKIRSKTYPGVACAIAEQLAGDARDYRDGNDEH